MLCDPPPANAEILPEASQGSYFFNRIGQNRSFSFENIDFSHGLLTGYEKRRVQRRYCELVRYYEVARD
jgi:hypothetical protein